MNVTARTIFSVFLLIAVSYLVYGTGLQQTKADEDYSVSQVEQTAGIPESPLILDVTLKRVYMDGEVSEENITEMIWALEDFWAKYEAWQLVDMDEERLVFETRMDDISPILKLNGFFGISDDGTLSIFNGKPQQADVIQSFFQLDIRKLEGNKHTQLKEGIPVKTKEDYVEVLETLKPYSLDID